MIKMLKAYTLQNILGPPEAVIKGFVGCLNQEFTGGMLHKSLIYFPDDNKGNKIGEYYYWRPHDCAHSGIKPLVKQFDYASLHLVLSGSVFEGDHPPH